MEPVNCATFRNTRRRVERGRVSAKVLGATVLVAVLLALSGRAQKASADVSPEVQKLYQQAHDAQGRGDIATAIERYQDILKVSPRLVQAYNNLGMLYYQKHDYAQAEAVLEKGVKVDPKAVTMSALLGSTEYAMGKYAQARPHLEAAVKGNPNDDFARAQYGRALFKLKNYEEAVEQFHVLVTHNPKDQDAWYQLGQAHLQLSEMALHKVSEIDPNSALSQEVAGEIMQDMGNSDGALIAYKKAVEIAPREPGTHEHLGGQYWAMGKWDSARSEFQAELENDPQNCQVRWKMANCLVNLHEPPEEALKELNAAIEQCPDLMPARVDRARTLIASGKAEAAVADLELAEKSDPQEPTIHFYLANAYRSQGRAADAHNEMQTYKQLLESASAAESKRAAEAESMKNNSH